MEMPFMKIMMAMAVVVVSIASFVIEHQKPAAKISYIM